MAIKVRERRANGMSGTRGSGVVLQCLSVLAGVVLLAGWPGGRATVLLLPLHARLADTINLALAHDARLIGAGPLRDSVIVVPRVSGLIGPMLRQGTLVIGIPAALCGAARSPIKAPAP